MHRMVGVPATLYCKLPSLDLRGAKSFEVLHERINRAVPSSGISLRLIAVAADHDLHAAVVGIASTHRSRGSGCRGRIERALLTRVRFAHLLFEPLAAAFVTGLIAFLPL